MNSLSYMNIFVYSFFGLLSAYSCHIFLSIALGFNKSRTKFIIVGYLIYFLVMAYVNFFHNSFELNFIMALISILALSTFYNSNIPAKLIYSIIITIFLILSEFFVLNVFSLTNEYQTADIFESANLVFFLQAISNFIPFVVVKIYSIFNTKRGYEINANISKASLIQLFAVPIISIAILQIIVTTINNDLHYVSVIITISFILINVIVLNLVDKINTSAEEKIENIYLNSKIDYYNSLYENLIKERNDTLKLKHNIKNSFISIKTSLIQDQKNIAMKKIDEVLGYDYYISEVFSEVPIVDAILNYKIQSAKKLNIKIHTTVSLTKEICVDEHDFVNILGNGLDNAIEACEKNLDLEKKYIEVQIIQNKNNIYIHISNPYEGDIVLKQGLPLSSKRENKHGIGIKTIEKIIKDNEGIINISTEKNIFSLEVILFFESK